MNLSQKNSMTRKNIIWAIDPTQDAKEAKHLIKELRIWAKHLDCDVQPVSIFSKSTLNLPVAMTLSWKPKPEEIARKSVVRYMRATKTSDFLAPELLFVPTISNQKMAAAVAKYAEKKSAPIIFANTRAKKTWNPFRLGGFAETLVATSRVPVLLLNPIARPSTQIPSILFPTDFSHDSKNALTQLVPWAKAFKSKVLVFNQIETLNIYPSEGTGMWPIQGNDLQAITRDIESDRQQRAEQITQFLKDEDIKATAIVRRQKKYISAEIIEMAKKHKVNLIALASRTGPLAQALLGGIAKEVLLQAKCPVIIFYRPKAARKLKTEAKRPIRRLMVSGAHTEALAR